MPILALDASTTSVGWAIRRMRKDRSISILSNAFKNQGDDWVERIENFGKWLGQSLMAEEFALVIFERATGNKFNMRTNIKLGGVQYEAQRQCRRHDYITFLTVTASSVKATGVYKGDLVAAELYKGKPLSARTKALRGDEADALGVLKAYLEGRPTQS